jgi:hypothetical protein
MFEERFAYGVQIWKAKYSLPNNVLAGVGLGNPHYLGEHADLAIMSLRSRVQSISKTDYPLHTSTLFLGSYPSIH